MAFRALGNMTFEAANIKSTSRGFYDIVTNTSEIAITEKLTAKTGTTFDLTSGGAMHITSEDEMHINSSGVMNIVGAGEMNITGGQVDIVGDPVTINNEGPTEATAAATPVITDTSIPVSGFEMDAFATPVGRAKLVEIAGPGADDDDHGVTFTEQYPYTPMNGVTPDVAAVIQQHNTPSSGAVS